MTFTLHNVTSGESWDYATERQLQTVAKLYAIQHPKVDLAVTIAGQTRIIRKVTR